MEKMKTYTFEEVKDELLGERGTETRDEYEARVAEAIQAYRLSEAIKLMRKHQHLTQSQLGEKIGVKKAWISKIENGDDITIRTAGRVFKALGVPSATLDLGEWGKLTLWE